MYYVDRKQIETRLEFIPRLVDVMDAVKSPADEISTFARDRALHLALETVTDVCSLLIDGFIMREASSYEDLVDVVRKEEVIDAETAETMMDLVRLRRPLVQDFTDPLPETAEPMSLRLLTALPRFADSVTGYMNREGV